MECVHCLTLVAPAFLQARLTLPSFVYSHTFHLAEPTTAVAEIALQHLTHSRLKC